MTDFSHLFLNDYSVHLYVCVFSHLFLSDYSVHSYVCVIYMHMCMHTCVGQMSVSGTFSVTPTLFFLI